MTFENTTPYSTGAGDSGNVRTHIVRETRHFCDTITHMKSLALVALLIALSLPAAPPAKYRVLFNRFKVPEIALYIADASGANERMVIPHRESEYSPSLSADGQWVIFTSEHVGQSDIYRAHPDGSGQEQLTSDPAFDDQAVLSPSGATLAFVSTRDSGFANIWLLDLATKKYVNLTKNTAGNFRPAWSPDGQWIAFSSDRDAAPGSFPGQWELLQSTGIYIVHPDGTGLRRLTKDGGFAGSPAWSPDGSQVMFYETDEVGAFLAESSGSRTEIISIDIKTGERKQWTASNETKLSPQWLQAGRIGYITRGNGDSVGLKVRNPDRSIVTVAKGEVRNAKWSADGKQVVYERILHRGATEHLVPTVSRDPDFELVLSEPFPSFSPDGTKLLYSKYGADGLSAGDTSIQIMNADGSGETTLFHRQGMTAYDSVWSPAGDMIAFCVGKYFRTPGLPPSQIALIKPDGSGFRTVAEEGVNNGFPSWSPDGKRLVYRRGKQLVILTLADGKIMTLTDGSHYDNFPEWSPRGDIMFTSDRDGLFKLFLIHPDGTGLKRLTTGPGMDAHSAWSRDGEWIAFSSSRKGFKDERPLYEGVPQPYGEIFAMRADGSDIRQLTDNKWEDASAGWAPDPAVARSR